jgi:hypothetical protein
MLGCSSYLDMCCMPVSLRVDGNSLDTQPPCSGHNTALQMAGTSGTNGVTKGKSAAVGTW